jgi:hypothetical protein
MTDQPIERPAESPANAIVGLTHRRHACGYSPEAALCGYIPETKDDGGSGFADVTDADQEHYQDCVVCESLYADAGASALYCNRCKGRITP